MSIVISEINKFENDVVYQLFTTQSSYLDFQ